MARMTTGRFRHLPVVKQEKLIGIVSIGDVVKERVEEIDQSPKHCANTSRRPKLGWALGNWCVSTNSRLGRTPSADDAARWRGSAQDRRQ